MPLSRFQPTFLQPPPMTAPPRLGQLPVSTASPVASGLQGLLQGYMAVQKQKAAEKQQANQEKIQKLEAFGAAMKAFGDPSPASELIISKWLQFGGAKPEEIKELVGMHRNAVKSKDTDAIGVIRSAFGKAGKQTDFDPRAFVRLYRENPTALFKLGEQAQGDVRQGEMAKIASRLGETSTPEQVRQQAFAAGFPQLGKSIAEGFGLNLKPPGPEGLVNVRMVDGSTRSFRAGDPRLDAAIRAGGIVEKTPAAQVNIAQGKTPEQIRLAEEAKALTKVRTERYNALEKQAKSSSDALRNLANLEPLLNKAQAGPGAAESARIKRFLSGFARTAGFEDLSKSIEGEGIGAAEAAIAVANRMTLDMKGVFELGVRGFDTPAEREFVQSLSPQLATSPKGRKILFPLLRKFYRRQTEVAKVARAYVNKNGLKGLEDHLDAKFPAERSRVFTEDDLRKFNASGAGKKRVIEDILRKALQ